MSDELFHREHMTVTSYAGPERADGGSRKRVQIYAHDGGDNRLIDLSTAQWDALGQWFAEQRHPSARARRPATGSG